MVRALLILLIAVPLLAPTGFCPCQLSHGECATEHDESAPSESDEHDDHDPNCPCHSIDYTIRGFVPLDSMDLGVCALEVELAPHVVVERSGNFKRGSVPMMASPSWFHLDLTFQV